MKLGDLFGKPKTLANSLPKKPTTVAEKPATVSHLAAELAKKPKPGEFPIVWPKLEPQKPKDYRVITKLPELEAYLAKCKQTGYGSFDYETAPEEAFRDHDRAALDPWKADICTLSISALPHESRVIYISHKTGSKHFEPQLSRESARKLVMDTVERLLFMDPDILKVAVNAAFETKFSAKHAKYIIGKISDPLVAWVRIYQVACPWEIKDEKRPYTGLGLKPMTKKIFGVNMSDFKTLLESKGVRHFDEMDTDDPATTVYSAEDSDYGLQHALYWAEVAKQVGKYYDWLHTIEMPFSRVIGLMEYWGMAWDDNLAQVKLEEALHMQEQAGAEIARIAKETFGLEVNVGKSGKTGDVHGLIFQQMKLPVAKYGKVKASLDEESLIDMTFMLENNLQDIDEEKYLAVELPEGWESLDPESDPHMDKALRMALRIKHREPHPYKEQGLQLLGELKKIQKYSTLISAHIEGRRKYLHEVSGRIHAQYSPWTRTARLNSFSPNGQNVPRMDRDIFGIRNFYVAPPGKVLFFIDFSGFELRLLAWKSGDEVMTDIFLNDGDMHARTASTATGKPEAEVTKTERQHAKPANFGIAYVGTEYALQGTFKTDYGIRKTLDECAKLIRAVKDTYKRIEEFQRNIVLEAREKGYVEAIYGYMRPLRDINSTNKYARGQDERRAANTPIQGSAADIMKRCQNEVYDEIGRGTFLAKTLEGYGNPYEEGAVLIHGVTDMIGQIHDEIIFQMDDAPDVVERAAAWIKATMEKSPIEGFPLPVRADASAAYAWGQKVSVSKWLESRRGN